MNKTVFSLCALLILALPQAEARVYKGQKEYIKNCKECHNNGQELAFSKKKKEWKKLVGKNGEGLAALHLERKKASNSWDYFKSSKYEKSSKHLRDFLMEYAKDSGNVPACD